MWLKWCWYSSPSSVRNFFGQNWQWIADKDVASATILVLAAAFSFWFAIKCHVISLTDTYRSMNEAHILRIMNSYGSFHICIMMHPSCENDVNALPISSILLCNGAANRNASSLHDLVRVPTNSEFVAKIRALSSERLTPAMDATSLMSSSSLKNVKGTH